MNVSGLKARLTLGVIGLGLLTTACADYPPPPPPPPPPPRYAYPPPPPPPPPRESYAQHVRWCFDHHKFYNPDNNVYIGSDGSPHICVEH